MSKTYEKHIQPNGMPRTKGLRNPIVEAMRGCKGGPMKNNRDKRANENKKSWQKEWDNEN